MRLTLLLKRARQKVKFGGGRQLSYQVTIRSPERSSQGCQHRTKESGLYDAVESRFELENIAYVIACCPAYALLHTIHSPDSSYYS